MIALPGVLRQALGAGLGVAAFLALLLGSGVAWWVALLGGLSAYAGLLLLTDATRAPASALAAGDDASREASARLADASARLRAAAEAAEGARAAGIGRIAALVEAIGAQHVADTGHRLPMRHFTHGPLGRVVALAEGGAGADAAPIEDIPPALHAVERACREGDAEALERAAAALDARLSGR